MFRLLMLFAMTSGFSLNLLATKRNETITLPDGRTLGYAIYGDTTGFPVFYFHGGQESRLSAAFMDTVAYGMGVQLIVPDRPGIGLSSFQPDRRFLDWAKDVTALADILGIERFSVFGLSGGAPHVLACAYEIPDRIEKATIVAGAAPYDYQGTKKGMWFPVKLIHWFASWEKDKQLRKFIQNDYKTLATKPEKRLKQLQKYLPKPDRLWLKEHPHHAKGFIKGSLESYRQGIDGVVQEWKLYVADWGFDIRQIQQPISLWYGDKDKMAPKYRAFYYHEQLPHSKLQLLKDEGHFSLIRRHLATILAELKN